MPQGWPLGFLLAGHGVESVRGPSKGIAVGLASNCVMMLGGSGSFEISGASRDRFCPTCSNSVPGVDR